MAEPTITAPRNETDRFIETISHVIEGLADVADFTEISGRLARALVDHYGATRAEIWLHHGRPEEADPALVRFAAKASVGDPPAADPAVAARLAGLQQSWTGLASDFLGGPNDGFVMAYPLQSRDRTVGAFLVYGREPFSDSGLGWARVYASISAVTLEDARVLLESRKAITQLQFLVEASQVLNSTLDLAELLDLILKLALREIGADRGSVYLVDQQNREIWTILAHGLQEQEIRLAFGRGVAGYVAETGQTLNVVDAYTCPQFDPSFDKKSGYRTRTILCMPIRNRQGEPAGILQLFNKLNGVFTKEDEEFLNAMSLQMALAMENARMHREIVEKKRLEKEMQLARGIQRSLLPEAPPTVPGFDIAVLNVPCFEVGGDYYDFLTLGPNTLLLVVADVEGKGVSSAMVMSNLQATLRALVMHLHSLEVITLSLNEMILADTRQEKYLSCFMGLVDTRRRGLHYINAGHIPPILVRKNGEVLSLEQGGMVIGLFSAVEYERGSMQLMPGDVLLCCTDGIIEACDKDHEEFGADRLVKIVQNNQNLSAQELVKVVAQDVEEFAKGGVHIDDKVLMVVKVLDDLDPSSPAGH